jgi:hypothetical protein
MNGFAARLAKKKEDQVAAGLCHSFDNSGVRQLVPIRYNASETGPGPNEVDYRVAAQLSCLRRPAAAAHN